MRLAANGQTRPRFKSVLGPDEQASLLAACPGVTAHGPDPQRLETDTVMDPVWGPLRRIWRAWSTDPEIRHHGSAGGVLTGLACFLLDTSRVDAVLHVAAARSDPMLTDARVSVTAGEAREGAQSRYGPAAPLVHVHRLLAEGVRFAVVAKPCDIAAMRNLAAQDPRVEQQVPYLLSFFCGGVPSLATAIKIAAHHGLPGEAVSLFRWRGEGWPGPTHLEGDGRSFQTWFDPTAPWGYDVQWRCKICPDAVAELADLACPDGWLLDDEGRPLHDEAPGVNVVVERTRRGSELLAAAVAAGYVACSDLTTVELESMHADHRRRRLGEAARLDALQDAGVARPDVRNYCVPTIRALAPQRLLEEQYRGALTRISRGQAEEPVDRTY
jgi:coenzyme F420 hydrogenase subunit beta